MRRFKDTLAEVQLVNRAPVRKLHTTYHRGPSFNKWLLLAESVHQLWVPPDCKDAFFHHLDRYQTAQAGQLHMQASTGRATIPASIFIHCLNGAGCDTIRLKAYGQKMPINQTFLPTEPAHQQHRWSVHNEWDIGKTFPLPDVWLWGSNGGRQRGVERYPMLVPASQDYGSVNIRVRHNGHNYSVKIYPRLVHVIKSFNSHLQGSVPKTLSGVRKQVQAALRMIHSLMGKDAASLGGFRIEVTVKAATLKEARTKVERTGFLEPDYWLSNRDRGSGPYKLSARLVPKEALLANANWVFQQAQDIGLFHGSNNDTPSKLQVQALTDVMNALGWNSGLRRPTKSLDTAAWWNQQANDTEPDLFQLLGRQHQTDPDIARLFERARALAGSIPCKANPDNRAHRYQINNRSPFRIRCCVVGCYNKLQRSAVVHWIAQLVHDSWINSTALLDALQDGAGS